jgi:hypothetical protein
MTTRLNKRWALAAAAVMVVGLAAACGFAADNDRAGDTSPGLETSDEASIHGSDGASAGFVESEPRDEAQVYSYSGALSPDVGSAPPSTEAIGGRLPALLDRKMIMTATITLETGEVSKRFEDVGNIAAAGGGFVTSSSFGNSGEKQTASITIRIPGESYQRTLVELRKLGDVKLEQSGANDVTEEYTDLEARLRGLRAVEQQYMAFLTRAVSIDEVLNVQDRLNGVRIEMEQVQGRINLLSNQTDLATITVHLDPPALAVEPTTEGGTTTPLEALENGWEASLALLSGVAVVALAVLAFSWWIVPLAVIGAFVLRRFLKGSTVASIAPAIEPTTNA